MLVFERVDTHLYAVDVGLFLLIILVVLVVHTPFLWCWIYRVVVDCSAPFLFTEHTLIYRNSSILHRFR